MPEPWQPDPASRDPTSKDVVVRRHSVTQLEASAFSVATSASILLNVLSTDRKRNDRLADRDQKLSRSFYPITANCRTVSDVAATPGVKAEGLQHGVGAKRICERQACGAPKAAGSGTATGMTGSFPDWY